MKHFNDIELEPLLKNNLFTDGWGVEILHKRGFGAYCGGKTKAVYDNGMAERFTENNINGSFKNYYRDVFMNFVSVYNHSDKAYEFEIAKEAEALSNLETISHIPKECTMYKYKAKKYRICGKRLFLPQFYQISGKFPLQISKTLKVIPNITTDSKGRMNIMLTNASFDATGKFECIVKSDKRFSLIGKDGDLLPIEQKVINSKTHITIENLSAWNYILLTNKISDINTLNRV